jgi:hypothetical protein
MTWTVNVMLLIKEIPELVEVGVVDLRKVKTEKFIADVVWDMLCKQTGFYDLGEFSREINDRHIAGQMSEINRMIPTEDSMSLVFVARPLSWKKV